MRRHRIVVAATAFVIAVSAVATAVILTRDDGSSQGAEAPVARSDPHAKRAVSKDLLNAVDKVTRTVSEAQLVATGRDLFRNAAFALDGEACQSCHTDGGANKDVGTTPHGVPGPIDQSFVGPRDPPTLFSVGRTDPYFWVGDTATLQEVATATIQNHFRPEFKASSGQIAQEAAALTAYMRTIKPPTTNFDRGTMSSQAQRGLELFQGKAGCVECHGGPDFTDNLEHNTLVPQAPPMFAGAPANNDHGRQKPAAGVCPNVPVDPLKPLECAFNTPTLRGNGLANTGPFMHNGRFATLEQVVSFYNSQSSVAPLGLTQQEQADLVAFLKEL